MSQRGTQRSHFYKVHTSTNHGPCSHCGQKDVSKRYVNLTKNKLDKISFDEYVHKTDIISDFFSCICRKCESKIKCFFFMVSEVNDNGTSSFKKLCQNVSCPYEKKRCFINHFNICDKSGNHTT